MAFIQINVSGNPSCGGVLSVDKRDKVSVCDGQVYSVLPGYHLVEITSGGQVWKINVELGNNDLLELQILSKGNTVITEPAYRVSELTEEGIEAGYQYVAQTPKGTVFDASAPRRSKKKMIVGSVFLFIGAFGGINYTSHWLSGQAKFEMPTLLVFGGFLLIGALLFALGFKKKVR